MKRIIKYTLILAIAAMVSSCMEEVGDFTVNGEAITGFELASPVNSATVKINTNALTETVVFSWGKAESGLGSALKYTILFDSSDGNFLSPKWSKVSDNSGTATTATLTFQELQQILSAAAGSGNTVKWNVKAENGSPNVKMGQVGYTLKLSLSTAGISNFKLTSPINKSIIQFDGTHEKDTLKFDWANATTNSGSLTYKFYIDKIGGDFSNPLLTLDADASGTLSQVGMTHGQWKTLLEQKGITKGSYIWTAKAFSKDLEWPSEIFNVYIEFVNWRKPIYIVGEGTSVGWDINNALEMAYVSPNLWTGTYLLKAGKEFKFFPEKGSWDNGIGADKFTNFIGCTGMSGGNLRNDGATDKYYIVVVDLNTKTVTVTESPKILGGSIIADWNPSASVSMQMVETGIFESYQYITVDGWGFKLVPTKNGWDGDFGKSKTVEGFLAQADEDNLTVPSDGFYRVRTNFNDMSYSVVQTTWGVIGDATPGGWGSDTNMTFAAAKGEYTWKVDITLTSGYIKFRANDDWGINFGDNGKDGTVEYNGDNIQVAAGNYHIELILNSATGFRYTIAPK